MCILFIYTNRNRPEKSNGYRLIIASNRDEDYHRPARPAFKCPHTNIIGGRDMQLGREGGMWLGISTTGEDHLKFAALLNAPDSDLSTPSETGRGPIVYNFLQNPTITPKKYIENELKQNNYSAYNCIMIDLNRNYIKTCFYSNSPVDCIEYGASDEEFLGFGNSSPKDPLKKVEYGTDIFRKIIQTSTDRQQLKTRLIHELLKSRHRNLPDPVLAKNATKVEQLSSIFVEVESKYGTRAHTLILVDYEGNVEFIEYSMKEVGNNEWQINEFVTKL